ncbi:hypothetical protein OG320_14995 [Microbispora sp. NBC_01189]|uniref:hypothetical protein n=1 Tax=Microbispora sp. NBC_01189 TaxID=2903583 RepID=UPI002E13FA06|nr:hypothetical protein OG320_14995 [Microbispora sp. NBC_01189]
MAEPRHCPYCNLDDPLRGTEFLNAPQHSLTEDAERTVRAVRDRLQVSAPAASAFPEPDAVSGDRPGRR